MPPKPIAYRNGFKVNFRDAGGKKHQVRFSYDIYANPKREAEAYIEAKYLGMAFLTARATLEKSIQDYLRDAELSGEKRPETLRKQREHLTWFCKFASEHLRADSSRPVLVTDVAPILLRSFKLWYFENAPLYQNGRRRTSTDPPKRTWEKYRISLSVFFKYAAGRGLIAANPMLGLDDLKVRKISTPEMRWFKERDLKTIFAEIDATSNPHYAAFFRMLCYTGMRPSEVIKLQWADVDLDGFNLHVRRQTKNYRNRILPLLPELGDHLKSIMPASAKRSQLVFADPKGNPYYSIDRWLRTLYRVLAATGIERANLYTFRHTYGTFMVRVTDLVTVRQLMGHSSVAVTEKYLHSCREYEREAVLKLQQIIPIGRGLGEPKDGSAA